MLEFRLLYQGQLLGASRNNTRADVKHEIRRSLHPQLRQLWKTKSPLREIADFHSSTQEGEQPPVHKSGIDLIADKFTKFGYRFVPIVTHEYSLRCSLDILFLRPEEPGMLIKSGDIDNRLKTLFDALRVPQFEAEIVGSKAADEDPFFCLLEDDNLITEIRVTTDQLLMLPDSTALNPNDSFLVITVKVKPTKLDLGNIVFA